MVQGNDTATDFLDKANLQNYIFDFCLCILYIKSVQVL